MRVTPLVRTKVEDDIVTIGIMSGTSLDGADAVAVRFRSDATGTDRMTTLGRAGVPMPPELHDALLSLALGNAPDEIERMGDAAVSLAKLYAEAVERLLKAADCSLRTLPPSARTARQFATGRSAASRCSSTIRHFSLNSRASASSLTSEAATLPRAAKAHRLCQPSTHRFFRTNRPPPFSTSAASPT